MSRTFKAGGVVTAGRRVLLRLLAAGRGVRLMLDTRDVQPGTGVSFIPAHPDHDALDAVAGCEYVDDRIRLQD